MARTPITTVIDTSGPFFSRDSAKTFRANVRDLMDATAALGEADVKAQLKQGEPGRRLISAGVMPARVSGHVIGRTRNLKGKKWQVTAVVSVNNTGFTKRQGIALMASASVLERRVHAFRRMASRLRRQRKLIQADLLKGLK